MFVCLSFCSSLLKRVFLTIPTYIVQCSKTYSRSFTIPRLVLIPRTVTFPRMVKILTVLRTATIHRMLTIFRMVTIARIVTIYRTVTISRMDSLCRTIRILWTIGNPGPVIIPWRSQSFTRLTSSGQSPYLGLSLPKTGEYINALNTIDFLA